MKAVSIQHKLIKNSKRKRKTDKFLSLKNLSFDEFERIILSRWPRNIGITRLTLGLKVSLPINHSERASSAENVADRSWIYKRLIAPHEKGGLSGHYSAHDPK